MANKSLQKEYLLFRTLLEDVFEEAGFKDKISLDNGNKKFKSISEKVEVSSASKVSRNTIRRYVKIYLGKIPFTAKAEQLDALCHYTGRKSWWSFLKNPKVDWNVLRLAHTVDINPKELKTLRENTILYYLNKEKFRCISIVGDFEQKFGKLPIEDFYTDVSVLEKEDIKSHKSILGKEKRTYGSFLYSEKLNTSRQLAEIVFLSNKRTLILGNPGVGKSTFARYICHKWAKGISQSEKIFLYIDLKNLDFDKNLECIPNYIYTVYFEKYETTNREVWPYGPNLLFVLDGFDEVKNQHKKIVFESLYQWIDEPHYILFSRPYGILNQQISYDSALEIIGFNPTMRLSYIENLMKRAMVDFSLKKIIKTIDENGVLSDFSYNPLMLSYIMLIFIYQGAKGLKNITSVYHLQSQISAWFKEYHLSKKTASISFTKTMQKAEAMALNMELDQEYVVLEKSFFLNVDQITNRLSKIGIGQKEELGLGYEKNWRFFFNSASFQEFLAAKAVIPNIEPFHIIMLLKNQLYWNFTQMIIGGLSLFDKDRVNATLELILIDYKKSRKKNLFYLYVILLGETPHDIIHFHLKRKKIQGIVKSLQSTHHIHSWSMMLKHSFFQIYHKASYAQKGYFIGAILDLAKKSFQDNPEHVFHYIDEIALKLQLAKDARFVKASLEQILAVITKYRIEIETYDPYLSTLNDMPKQNYLDDERISRYIGFIHLLFKQLAISPKGILKNYKDILTSITDLSNTFKTHTIPLLDSIQPKSYVKSQYITFLHSLRKKLKTGYYEDNTVDINDKEHDLSLLGIKTEGLALSFKGSKIDEKNEVVDHIFDGLNMAKKLIFLLSQDSAMALDPFITAINELKATNFVGNLIDLLFENKIIEWIETDDMDVVEHHILLALEDYIKRLDNWDKFNRFFNILSYFEYGKYALNRHQDTLYIILNDLLERYGPRIERKHTKFKRGNTSSYYTDKAKSTITRLLELATFPHSRYFLFLKLTRSPFIKLNYVKEELIPLLIISGLSNHSKEVWSYVHRLAHEGRISEVLSILDKEEIYSYSSNYPEIIKLMELIDTDIKNHTFSLESPTDIHYFKNFCRIGYHLTRAMLYYKKTIYQYEHEIVCQLTEILYNENLRLFREHFANVMIYELDYFKLFPLQLIELSDDEELQGILPLKQVYTSLEGDFDFCNNILRVFSLEKIENYQPILGKRLVNIILKHQRDYLSLFQQVNVQEIKQLHSSNLSP
ncbi:NACHT domain-containing protein [Spongiimicrobium salis]|uniref:NACHT domain-containing protein n=1 Tax=Spongiimicrobium salis TaxID=1667022 RepID=UPI00374D2B92